MVGDPVDSIRDNKPKKGARIEHEVSEWLHASDGLTWEYTIVAALLGQASIEEVLHPTQHQNLSFIASAFALEEYGRDIVHQKGYFEGYTSVLAIAARCQGKACNAH